MDVDINVDINELSIKQDTQILVIKFGKNADVRTMRRFAEQLSGKYPLLTVLFGNDKNLEFSLTEFNNEKLARIGLQRVNKFTDNNPIIRKAKETGNA